LNATQLGRHHYQEWVKRCKREDQRYFRDIARGFFLEATCFIPWDGYDGRVNCKHVLTGEEVNVCYTILRPLNAMEVLAYAASAEG